MVGDEAYRTVIQGWTWDCDKSRIIQYCTVPYCMYCA